MRFLFLALALGCGESGRARAWRTYHGSFELAYPLLWGQPPDAAAEASARRTFDCEWDGAERAKVDPAPAIACLVRRLDATRDLCTRADAGAADCIARANEVCTPSAAFREVVEACSLRP